MRSERPPTTSAAIRRGSEPRRQTIVSGNPSGLAGHGGEMRIAAEHDLLARRGVLHDIRPRRRDELVLPEPVRRVGGHGERERQRQAIEEVGLWLGQVERDRASAVVCFDPLRQVARMSGRAGISTDDARHVCDPRRRIPVRVQVREHPLDRATEVLRAHGLSVRITDPLAQVERVRLPVRARLRKGLRKVGHERRPLQASGSREAHQAVVRESEHVPRRREDRDRRVEGVEARVQRLHRERPAPVCRPVSPGRSPRARHRRRLPGRSRIPSGIVSSIELDPGSDPRDGTLGAFGDPRRSAGERHGARGRACSYRLLAIVFVFGSIRETVPSNEFATQTPPGSASIACGLLPTVRLLNLGAD